MLDLLAQAAVIALEQAPQNRVERQVAAMGTRLALVVEADSRAVALAASEAALRAVAEVEQRLSTWRADSELSLLNAAPPGVVVELSTALAEDLERADELFALTNGAFDPGLGALTEVYGLRTGGRWPSSEELQLARAAAGYPHLIREGRSAHKKLAGFAVEEGAFGKGAGLDAAHAALLRAGARRGVLDFGGQILAFGHDSPIDFEIADPRARQEALLTITIRSGSLATSGNSERGFELDGLRYAHIIEPATGRPARDFGSVTVWAQDAFKADALSTAMFVLGPDEALRFAEAHAGVELVVVESEGDDLTIRASAGLADGLTHKEPRVERTNE